MSTITELRQSGEYPVMDLSIFDSIEHLELSDFSQELLYELSQKYYQTIERVLSLPINQQSRFLSALKEQDIIDSQTLELLDPYYVSVYLNMDGVNRSGIQYLLDRKKLGKSLTSEDLKIAHAKLLRGTDNDYEGSSDFRNNNDIYVSKSGKGDLKIHYFPIDYLDIPEAIEKLFAYSNQENEFDDYITKPIILHGLIGALQLFKDGNTRLGRLIQTIKIFELTSSNITTELSSPLLYASNVYKLYRQQYRDLIGDIAIDANAENWNRWLRFNANRMDEQLHKANRALRLK